MTRTGNKASQTDPDGNLTQYAYDGDGHLTATTLANYTGSPPGSQPAGPLAEESRAYDPAGRLAQVTDAMGRQTGYTYLDNDLLAQETQASPSGSSSFTAGYYGYDGAGNVNEEWAGNGETYTTTAFDAADQRLPWQQPCLRGRLTPARVRRGFRAIHRTLPVLTAAPKPGKPGPGRPPGAKNRRPATRRDVGKAATQFEPADAAAG